MDMTETMTQEIGIAEPLAGFGGRWLDRPLRPEGPQISVVIPTKDEARNIGWVLRKLPEAVDEVILVDSSTDDTVGVARAIRPDVRIVREPRPGKGAALRTGFSTARGEFVVMIDADGSMDPQEIRHFSAALEAGFDMVKGSRFMPDGGTEDMGWLRQFGNAVLRGITNLFYGCRFTDLCYGFMAFRRDCLGGLDLQADGFEIETEIVVRAVKSRLDIAEVPSFEALRRNGDSHLNTWRDGQRVLRTLLRERLVSRARAEVSLPESAAAPQTQPSVAN